MLPPPGPSPASGGGNIDLRRCELKNGEVRMVSATGILGYGFPEASLKAGLDRKPHMIGVDGGSSDPGPHYLGSGKTFTNILAIKRDLSLLLRGAVANKIPMMIGTCGGAGGEPHLQICVELLHEISRAFAMVAAAA